MGELPDFELTYREPIIRRQTQQVATATVCTYTVGRLICITATVVITVEGFIICLKVTECRSINTAAVYSFLMILDGVVKLGSEAEEECRRVTHPFALTLPLSLGISTDARSVLDLEQTNRW